MQKRCSKRGLLKFFGPILGFYTKNSPRNSWSPHFRITIWYQKSRNAGTSCINQLQISWLFHLSYLEDPWKFSMFFFVVFQASTGKKLRGRNHRPHKFDAKHSAIVKIPKKYDWNKLPLGKTICLTFRVETLSYLCKNPA